MQGWLRLGTVVLWAHVAPARGQELQQVRRATDRPGASARAWLQRGFAELRAGNPELARDACRTARGQAPDAWRAELCIGRAEHALGRWDAGDRALRRAAQQAPNSPRPWRALGDGALRRRAPRVAEQAFRQALKLAPESARLQLRLGLALSRQQRWSEAEAALREALRRKPTLHHAHLNLGVVLVATGRHDEARASYLEATRIDPDAPEAWHNLGNLARRQGDLMGAARYHGRAFEAAPERPSLGLAALASAVASGKRELALRITKRLEALRLSEDQSQTLERLRRALGPKPETPAKKGSPAAD
ncbi:MAG TPA: tetratricopeptide repeat protein [Myxococcales bacterium LLY-WYZ-16_1]|nr:tetratricopeptide repeat protein [Myxococcales bacterium LLY-WYZ-16_1]